MNKDSEEIFKELAKAYANVGEAAFKAQTGFLNTLRTYADLSKMEKEANKYRTLALKDKEEKAQKQLKDFFV